METYTLLRVFADSWMLLAMTVFYVGVGVWAFRPGSRAQHDATAQSIFRNEDTPAGPVPDMAQRDGASKEVRK